MSDIYMSGKLIIIIGIVVLCALIMICAMFGAIYIWNLNKTDSSSSTTSESDTTTNEDSTTSESGTTTNGGSNNPTVDSDGTLRFPMPTDQQQFQLPTYLPNTPVVVGNDTPTPGYILIGGGMRSATWPRVYCPKNSLTANVDANGKSVCRTLDYSSGTPIDKIIGPAEIFGTCLVGQMVSVGKCAT